ncbi:hypothetical protein ACVXHB_30065 [Escherichia coli]
MSKAFALAGLGCGFYAGKRRSHQPADESDRPYPLSTPVADVAAPGVKPAGMVRHARTGESRIIAERRIPDCRIERNLLRGAGFEL